MYGISRQTPKDTRVSEYDILDCLVIGQHRHHGISVAYRRDRAGCLGACANQILGLSRSAVVDRYLVSGFKKIRRHAGAHLSRPNEADFHGASQSNLLQAPRQRRPKGAVKIVRPPSARSSPTAPWLVLDQVHRDERRRAILLW